MPSTTSFYHAIFKRLQASYHSSSSLSFGGHLSQDDSSPSLYGGFSLKWVGDPHGLFGSLSAAAPAFPPLKANLQPLAASLVPADNPLYAMLAASLGPDGTIPDFVTVAGQQWPVMPPPESGSQTNQTWLDFNTGTPPALVAAFGAWITNGKVDDSPKGPLLYPTLMATPPAPFPGATSPILFVASMPNDDGRRAGDNAQPAVPLNHVPANYWDTSQVFLTDANGNIVPPANQLQGGAEYNVQAVLGVTGPGISGSLFGGTPIHVLCDAFCFNTFLSPNFPLPSLANLDPTDPNPVYEQYYFDSPSYEIAGFRFNVDAVFAGLAAALQAQNIDLGGLTAAAWLHGGHACVKVRIVSGEYPNGFTSQGAVPSLMSDPLHDRHITQHNLAPFSLSETGMKKIGWTNFILSQAGRGPNGLAVQHALPADAAGFALAIPTRTYERYIAPGLSTGGGTRGFELVREVESKPFPDAVILRQTTPDARLEIAEHGAERYLGLSLGVAFLKEARPGDVLGDIVMVHSGPTGAVVGGFTLRPSSTRLP